MAHIPQNCENVSPEAWTALAEDLEEAAKETRHIAKLRVEAGLAGYAEALETWAFRFRERSVIARFHQEQKNKGKE